MHIELAKERVEQELFLAYTEELEVEIAPFSDGDGGYEDVVTVDESDEAKRYREAMETIGEL